MPYITENPIKYNILCADFETWMCGECNEYNHKQAYVWLAGYKYLYDDNQWIDEKVNKLLKENTKECLKNINDEDVKIHKENVKKIANKFIFSDIQSFIWEIYSTVENPVIYFHNGGKFDNLFLINYFVKDLGLIPINDGLKLKNIPKNERFHFSYVISNRIIYELRVYIEDKVLIFRDSYRLIQKSIQAMGGKKIGKFDDETLYKHKKLDSINDIKLIDLAKFQEDIDTMRINLQADLFYGKEKGLKEIESITIASKSYRDQQKPAWNQLRKSYVGSFIAKNTNNCLSVKEWDYYAKFYRGGLVYINEKFKNKVVTGLIYHYDVNSLYPFVMKDCFLPFGKPMKSKPIDRLNYTTCYKVFIKEPIILKKGRIPYIGVMDDDDDINTYPAVVEPQYLYVFDFELEWILEQYEMNGKYEIKEKSYFYTKKYLSKWIEKWEEKKVYFNNIGDKVNRNSVKLVLNSGYGKYGQKRLTNTNILKFKDVNEMKKLHNKDIYFPLSNGSGCYLLSLQRTVQEDYKKLKYIPLASYITAKARIYISKIRQEYSENLIYGDTDDLYLLNTKIDDKYIDEAQNKKGEFGLLSFDYLDDLWEQICIKGAKKYMLVRNEIRIEKENETIIVPANKIEKLAGFVKPSTKDIYDFNERRIFPNSKRFVEYYNGTPIIKLKDGLLK